MVRTSSLSWATGLFCAGLGALMLIAPHQFESTSYPALRTNTLGWGGAFLLAGAGLLASVALAPTRWVAVASHALAGGVLLLIAQGFGSTGGVTGSIVYGMLGLATAAAPFLPRSDARSNAGPDLLALVAGTSAALIGATLLALPAQPAFDGVRPYTGALGPAFLGSGLALLYVQLRSAPPGAAWAAHLALAATYWAFAGLVALPNRGTTGLLYYGGFGLAVALLPWLGPRMARVDPASLRTRVATALIAAAALPLLIAVAVGNDQAERARMAEATAEQGALAASLGRDAATYVGTYRATVVTVASRFDPAWSPEQQRAALQSLTITDAVGFELFDPDGRSIARADDLPAAPLDAALAAEMRRTGTPAQALIDSPRHGRPVLAFAAPMRAAGGEIRGFVAFEVDATRLAALLQRARPTGGAGGATVFVVGGDGRVISHAEPSEVPPGADLAGHPVVVALRSGGQGGALRIAAAGGDQLAGYARAPGLEWGVVAERPVADVVAATRGLRDVSFGFLVAVTVVAAAAGAVAAERLARPLGALAGAIDRFAAGDATAPLPRSEIGEVAHLTGLFGQMRDRLAARTAEREAAEAATRESNRRLAEALDELRLAQSQMVQQERLRAMGEMASGIAHDFNNQLGLITGYADLLRSGGARDPKLADEAVDTILTAAGDAAAVVRGLRAFYRREGEALEGELSPVDVGKLVLQVITITQARWRDQALARGVTIAVKSEIGSVPPIAGQESELRDALTNLIFNAVDALPAGGVITVRATSENDRVVLEVSDSGVGMPEEVRRRCFEPFFSTKGMRGTGLGLAMVHGIVRRHGGTIDVESEPGRGTTFRICLPVRPAGIAEAAAPEASSAEGLRILVVDDELGLRRLAEHVLSAAGHRVETAADGLEGLEKFRQGNFDLVVTDRAMPEMNGDQLAAAVKDLAPGTPVILTTGFGDLMKATGEVPEGVDAVVSKPFTGSVLKQAVARIAAGRSS
jgi:signal transduction histidine kinase/ActR/RegA family two-component response regulator